MLLASENVMTERETMPIRIAIEAIREARIAAAARGLSLTRYASDVLLEKAARRDIEAWSKARGQEPPKGPNRRKVKTDDQVRRSGGPCQDALVRGQQTYRASFRQQASWSGEHQEAGKYLLEVKASLPHGEFMAWVARNCPFGDRTAQRYMRSAKTDTRVGFEPKSISAALRMLTDDSEHEGEQNLGPSSAQQCNKKSPQEHPGGPRSDPSVVHPNSPRSAPNIK